MNKNYKIFQAFKTNSVGVWYFVPEQGAFKTGKPCKGFGAIKYAEGSVYTGEIYYDGKNFNKLGYGQQDFSRSDIGNIIPAIGEKKYKYAGRYDYRKTDWIYGNGVVYYTDAEGNPTHFRKGFYKGLDKVGEYGGELDSRSLLTGYSADMETDYDEEAGRLEERWRSIQTCLKCADAIRVLFLGDSYFELSDNESYAGDNLFKNYFPNGYVNIGVGGSQFSDWLEWVERIKNIPAPEHIVINLGFNDIHAGKSSEKVYRDFKKLLNLLRLISPTSNIYLIAVVHAPNCANFYDEENVYNAKIKKYAEKNGVTVGDWNGLIASCGENCFHSDAVHPNEKGYGLFRAFIENLLRG